MLDINEHESEYWETFRLYSIAMLTCNSINIANEKTYF